MNPDRKDILRFNRGAPGKVGIRIVLEFYCLLVLMVLTAWLNPVKIEMDPFPLVITTFATFWFFIRAFVPAGGPCVNCKGSGTWWNRTHCADCLIQLDYPTHYEMYEPKTLKEKIHWHLLERIPKSSRSRWDGDGWLDPGVED